jgi:tetratricopeptide (TPR) repeat protein
MALCPGRLDNLFQQFAIEWKYMFDDILKSAKSGGDSPGLSKSGGGSLGSPKSTGKGLGSSKTPKYPDGFSEGSLSWSALSRTIVESLADLWFDAYGPVPILESMSKEAALDPKKFFDLFAPFLFGDNPVKIIPTFKKEYEDFGEIQKIDESPLGKSLIATLDKLGVIWFYETAYPLDETTSIEMLDAHDEGIAQWTSYFGMPVQQRFRVYKDKKGVETIVWFSQVLAATRPFEHLRIRSFEVDGEKYESEVDEEEVSKGALTFGQWSTEFFIPSLAKKLFYLAETQFPSSLFSLPRTSAYSGLDEAKLPVPFLVNERRASAVGVFSDEGDSLLVTSTLLPNVISMGWAFTASDHESLDIIISRISDGLVRISSYLEDGYLNCNEPDNPYQFNRVVLSATVFDEECEAQQSALGLSRWIPVIRVGFLLNESNVRGAAANEAYGKGRDDKHRSEFAWLAEDGAGAFVASAINTLVYSWLISEKRWDEIDRLLDAAARLNVKDQSTNALSNWAISYHLRGDEDTAIRIFGEALEREDRYAEREATYFLALIWDSKGDKKKADEYRARCDAAGGYSSPDFMSLESGTEPSADKTRPLGKTSDNTRSKFCTSCGAKFATDVSRFCGECGTQRA